MSSRRRVVLALGASALAASVPSFAQPASKVWRIGFISPSSEARQRTGTFAALLAVLYELGYVEGKNVAFEYAWAEGKPERLPALAADLVRKNVDLIVSNGTAGTVAAGQATRTIPIVVAASGDLIPTGLAASLAKPGGNVTGQIFFAEALGAKGLELLKEAVPKLATVGILVPPDDAEAKLVLQAIAATAKHLRVEIPQFPVAGPADFERAFAAMVRQHAGAVQIPNNPLLNFQFKVLVDLAMRHRLPSCGNADFAQAGGLLGFGVDFFEMYRKAAVFVDKILKGAKPGDIPIEQATKFELVVNLKTAKALRIKIPEAVLVRATKVIE